MDAVASDLAGPAFITGDSNFTAFGWSVRSFTPMVFGGRARNVHEQGWMSDGSRKGGKGRFGSCAEEGEERKREEGGRLGTPVASGVVPKNPAA